MGDMKIALKWSVLITSMVLLLMAVQLYAQATTQPEIRVIAPIGNPLRPLEDGTCIVAANPEEDWIRVEITIALPEDATQNYTNIEVWGDATGEPEGEYNLTFTPHSSRTPSAVLYGIGGEKLDTLEGSWQGDTAYFVLPHLRAGETWRLYYEIVPPPSIPKEPYSITLKIRYKLGASYGVQEIIKTIKVINPPVLRLWIVIGLTLVLLVALMGLGAMGFFRLYSSVDLVSISMIAAAMVVWVQILGRQLIFPLTNRIPFTYNFAVADIPYVLLLVTSISIVRKPGAASLTLFIYNIVSEIGWYGINPLWWAYPFAQGLPVDFYIMIRGKGILTDKIIFFKYRMTEEEWDKAPELKGLALFDGLMIGLLRGFFMQMSLYTVFYPNLFRLQYNWGYVFWWNIIPWSIGNAVGGCISVPIAERIREAAQY